jgi:hypothetical protein
MWNEKVHKATVDFAFLSPLLLLLMKKIKVMNLPAPDFCCSNSDERLEANGVKKNTHTKKYISITFYVNVRIDRPTK